MTLQRIITNAIENNAVDSTKIADNAVGVTQLSVQADGNAGEFLQTNGAGILSFATAASTLTGGSGLVGIQTFGSVISSPGTAFGNGIHTPNITTHTWTKPAGVTRILYFVTGGGGGDGIFSDNGDGTQGSAVKEIRNFGGGGGTVMGFLDVTNIVSETVTVGSCGGNSLGTALLGGGGVGLSAGSAGEASTFGSHATAFGGGGGLTGVNGGSGVNPNDTTAAAAGNHGGGGGTGGSVQMRGSASTAGPTPGTSFWGETPGGGNGNINRANQGGSGIVVILEFA